MMNPMCSSVILLFCVAFIMFDHCSVLAMQSGRNIHAKPFIPQQQQQQQQEQQQTQWQEEYERTNLYGSPPSYHRQPMPHNLGLQIPPQYLEASNFYGMASSPLQYHQHQPVQQFSEHLGHQFPPQHLGGHQQMIPSSPLQTRSPMHLAPVADSSSSSQMMSPMNPFNTAFSSKDPLCHLTSLLQTIPQGTSLFSEDPASIVGTSNKQLKAPLNPARVISPSSTGSSRITDPSAVKEDRTEKFMFGTIEHNELASLGVKKPEKPKSRGIPPGFPVKNPSGSGDASSVKEVTKYLETVKKPSTPHASKSPPKEEQINSKSPKIVESEKTRIPGENVGDKTLKSQQSKTSDPDDKMSWRKQENSSTAGASSTKPEGTLSKNKNQKRNQGKQRGNNNNQGEGTSTKINPNRTFQYDKGIEIIRTGVAPNEANATIPAEFSPINKGKYGKLEDSANPSESAAKKANDDEDLGASLFNEIKLDSKLEKEISGSSSDFIDAQDMGLEEETFADALPFFETKVEKKKTAKQLKREKELEDAKEIEKSAKKREQELADAKGKAKAEEITEEIDEESAKNKEKLKAAKDRLELNKNTDRVQNAIMEDLLQQSRRDGKNKAKNFQSPSTPVTSVAVQQTSIDHHTEIKMLINILNYERIMGISIENADNEEQAKKDIRYLLYTIQVFYEALCKYWHDTYYLYDLHTYMHILTVFNKFSQIYNNYGSNMENPIQFERAEILLTKSIHILGSFWMIPKYRKFMKKEMFKEEGKYRFVKWMEAFEELLDALKQFYIKIKRFNRSNAKKNGSLMRLRAHFMKSTILPYFETNLNMKLQTIFGIVFIGMDMQGSDYILARRGIMAGLKYLQYWMPGRKAELVHTRKIMWKFAEILDYITEKEIRNNFKTYFLKIIGYPMPEGNYIKIEA